MGKPLRYFRLFFSPPFTLQGPLTDRGKWNSGKPHRHVSERQGVCCFENPLRKRERDANNLVIIGCRQENQENIRQFDFSSWKVIFASVEVIDEGRRQWQQYVLCVKRKLDCVCAEPSTILGILGTLWLFTGQGWGNDRKWTRKGEEEEGHRWRVISEEGVDSNAKKELIKSVEIHFTTSDRWCKFACSYSAKIIKIKNK